MNYREAVVEDITGMHTVRVAVLENRLSDPNLITPEDYEEFITRRGKGWVCEADNQIVGFAIVDTLDHNVWALFIDPAHEGKGIGRKLHDTMIDWYFDQTDITIWLGTAPKTRAEQFYRKAGWKETGMHGKEIKFEMAAEDWRGISNFHT
jgi:GNAT superfamily N-acetyltransferase